MFFIEVLTECKHCEGKAYLPHGKLKDWKGEEYTNYLPCTMCHGSGKQKVHIQGEQFMAFLEQQNCPHEHTSTRGGYHFSAGDVWDDIEETCDDCGLNLDSQ